jgi:NodT family efflux transporter outer membrane factor (OMF) lipoprotein
LAVSADTATWLRQGRRGAVALAGLMVSACAVGPAYVAPQPATPPAFRNAADAAADDGTAWWARFGDPVLDGLVSEAAAANLDVKQATARVLQARVQARIAGAKDGPTVTASGQASRTRLSKNGSIAEIAKSLPTGGAIGLPGSDITNYQTGLDASWELDLFGGDSRAVEAAQARGQGAEWTVRDVKVSLTAEVARAYFQYRLVQARLVLTDRRAAEQRDSLATVAARIHNGLATTIDQRRAEQRLAATAAARQALLADREAQLQALAVLLAQPASAIESRLGAAAADADAPPVPAGLPSELLRRRPDVRAAERRLAAATADIGAATADLYPKLTLTGGLDLVSSSLGSLISLNSLQPSAAARLAFPLLDGGVRRATVDLRGAQRDEAYAAYQGVVLAALRDVEVALSRLTADRARLTDLAAAEAASQDAYDTAGVQQRAGLTGSLELFTAQDDWISAQDAIAQAQAQVLLDVVALGKALGGGWAGNDRSDR